MLENALSQGCTPSGAQDLTFPGESVSIPTLTIPCGRVAPDRDDKLHSPNTCDRTNLGRHDHRSWCQRRDSRDLPDSSWIQAMRSGLLVGRTIGPCSQNLGPPAWTTLSWTTSLQKLEENMTTRSVKTQARNFEESQSCCRRVSNGTMLDASPLNHDRATSVMNVRRA